MQRPLCFMITRLLASGARLYVAAIALALAYEMISGGRPGQTETLVDLHRRRRLPSSFSPRSTRHSAESKPSSGPNFIQASIMMGSALVALGLPLLRDPRRLARNRCSATADSAFPIFSPRVSIRRKHGWEKWKGMFEIELHDFRRIDWIDIHHHVQHTAPIRTWCSEC